MQSLFSSRKKKAVHKSSPASSATRKSDHPLPAVPHDHDTAPARLLASNNADEFGRHIHVNSPPAFTVGANPTHQKGLVPRQMADEDFEELQLAYGYWPIETQRSLSISEISKIISLCSQEIRSRGLEEPLLFSSYALDLSMAAVCSLIRLYFHSHDAFERDIQFANPHDLGGLLKWALGRYISPQGTKGYISFELYERWRIGERDTGYQHRYISTHLLQHLPTFTSELLSNLLSLLSSACAYSTKNGATPRKVATIFSSYIFGLSDDKNFDDTYIEFQQFSHATEHLLLAYMREQKATSNTGILPTKLIEYISNYPNDLQNNINRPPGTATLVPLCRISRQVRFYSRDLIASSRHWEVPRSQNWSLTRPVPISHPDRSLSASTSNPTDAAYTPQYRHLLNIRSFGFEEDEDDVSLQRFKSVVDKQWKEFSTAGFAANLDGKLKFDLSESERQTRRKKHETMDWTTFESSGFGGRETYVSTDLDFDPTLTDSVTHLDEDKVHIANKLRKVQKALPAFHYDITAAETDNIFVDQQIFEAWADVLVCSGWSREEVGESNWALLHYKTRAMHPTGPIDPSSDGRTESKWFLIEEVLPNEYRQNLLDPKRNKRASFLRSVRRKPGKSLPPMPTDSPVRSASYQSMPASPSALDNSVFTPGSGGQTKLVSLSKDPSIPWSLSSLTKSNKSTPSSPKNQSHSAGKLNASIRGPVPSPTPSGGSSGKKPLGGGVGYTKPKASDEKEGFLSRLTKKGKKSSPPSPNTAAQYAMRSQSLDVPSPSPASRVATPPQRSPSPSGMVHHRSPSPSGMVNRSPSPSGMVQRSPSPAPSSPRFPQDGNSSFTSSGPSRHHQVYAASTRRAPPSIDTLATNGHRTLRMPSPDPSMTLPVATPTSEAPRRSPRLSHDSAYSGVEETEEGYGDDEDDGEDSREEAWRGSRAVGTAQSSEQGHSRSTSPIPPPAMSFGNRSPSPLAIQRPGFSEREETPSMRVSRLVAQYGGGRSSTASSPPSSAGLNGGFNRDMVMAKKREIQANLPPLPK